MKKLAASIVIALVLAGGSVKPARADWTGYNPTPGFQLLQFAPDICAFGGCILLSQYSTAWNEYNQVMNDIQQGQMAVQNLRSGISRLGNVGDPSGANVLGQLLAVRTQANPTQTATVMNLELAQASQANQADIAQLLRAMQTVGTGTLAAQQISGVVLQKIAASMETRNQIQAAQEMQTAANIQQSYANLGSAFDLNGAPTAGWAF